MDIRISADTSLAAAIRKAPSDVERQLRPALLRSAGEVAREMKRGAAKAHSVLTNSINAELTGPLSARAVAGAAHGAYVEHGTGPGGSPPRQSLLDWMRVHGIATGDDAEDNRTAFLISRAIHKRGTRAQPFAAPAREKTAPAVQKRLDAAVRRALAAAGLS